MNYHAHVYWRDPTEKETAIFLRPHLKEIGCILGTIQDRPIGPHPLPMYQIYYNDRIDYITESILKEKIKSPILIHEDTGNDIRDHTEGARWLNEELPLNLKLFG